MSWNATGERVLLQITEPANETRTVMSFEELPAGVWFELINEDRTVKIERAEWRGLTAAGAASKTATSGWTITDRARHDDSAQWRVVEERITYGEWTEVVEE